MSEICQILFKKKLIKPDQNPDKIDLFAGFDDISDMDTQQGSRTA